LGQKEQKEKEPQSEGNSKHETKKNASDKRAGSFSPKVIQGRRYSVLGTSFMLSF
jgi:hypothetical protein